MADLLGAELTEKHLINLAAKVGKALKKRGDRLIMVESCTGGLASAVITEVAGCSAWFDSGIVTYSNQAKQDLVHVKDDTIEMYGAVSEEVAAAMVNGALFQGRATISASITGVAGPTGGTKNKPVGMVCFGWAGIECPLMTRTQIFTVDQNNKNHQKSRRAIRMQAVEFSLNGILELLAQAK